MSEGRRKGQPIHRVCHGKLQATWQYLRAVFPPSPLRSWKKGKNKKKHSKVDLLMPVEVVLLADPLAQKTTSELDSIVDRCPRTEA